MKITIFLFALFALVYVTMAESDTSRECEPNTQSQDDCNTCFCNKFGKKICTLKACPPKSLQAPSCTPGKSFKMDCNTCICNEDGTVGACTLMACAVPIE